MFLSRFLVLATLLAAAISCLHAAGLPEFMAVTAKGIYKTYSNYTVAGNGKYTVSDSVLSATLTDQGNDIWQLSITPKVTLGSVRFPWMTNRDPLDSDISNDVYYYPIFLGIGQKAEYQNNDGDFFGGTTYPGGLSAPLVVVADEYSAKIVAAVNWPPQPVRPFYGAQRMFLVYDKHPVPSGTTATYKALIATISGGDPSAGVVPWQLALDRYRAWLDSVSPKVTYPSWMWAGEGFFNVQSEWQAEFNPFSTAALASRWLPVKELYPWIVIWGQMSPFGGDCCGIDPVLRKYYPSLPMMDNRLIPGMADWIKSTLVANGYHAAYYSAPYMGEYGNGTDRLLDTPAGLGWLTNFNKANEANGANSYYLDTLARHYWGDPGAILKLFKNGTLPKDAMSEGLIDIYPVPGLVSGALRNDGYCGAPYRTPLNTNYSPADPMQSDYDFGRISFPRFGRYLLGDRLAYGFYSNGDWIFWGSGTWDDPNSKCNYSNAAKTGSCDQNGPCDHGSERLAFLLGTKLDVLDPSSNPVLDQLISEHKRIHWWARRPVYVDSKGLNLTTIPSNSKVEVSRFIDVNGDTLLAVTNPKAEVGISFHFNGQKINVTTDYLHIVDLKVRSKRTKNARSVH
jgi:hypothetical protein